ncbi:MAG: hypothetical protein EB027_07495 [Actinobacteria bacterium]|nr:hypothetical protein [Actinomycetota bacterium]
MNYGSFRGHAARSTLVRTTQTVARAYPEFCEAETKAISEVLGRNVVRLSTIGGGGHICTTLVPPPVSSGTPASPGDAGSQASRRTQLHATTPDEGTQ